MKAKTKQAFRFIYGYDPMFCAFAPGRVNLIGEHTDYNGGHVFPCALSMGIFCAAAPRQDRTLRLYSSDFAETGVITCTLDDMPLDHRWADYPKAVLTALSRFGYPMEHGADLLFAGDLPDGAGLSSSAALEVLTGVVANRLGGFGLSAQLLALCGQFAENRFIGVNCGIMDQFACAMGRRGNAMLLNTDTMACQAIPIPSDRYELVLINSGVKHSLASSAYNDRRHECEAALKALQAVVKAPNLCALSPDEFEQHKGCIKDEIIRRRAKHAVYENHRTLQAAEALRAGDLRRFGELMNASHASLQQDYAVSCRELDLLADEARRQEGVYGSRMTGGGFGGCTVTLIDAAHTDRFVAHMTNYFEHTFDKPASIYTAAVSDGARILPDP